MWLYVYKRTPLSTTNLLKPLRFNIKKLPYHPTGNQGKKFEKFQKYSKKYFLGEGK
jgi:hypothetical protein